MQSLSILRTGLGCFSAASSSDVSSFQRLIIHLVNQISQVLLILVIDQVDVILGDLCRTNFRLKFTTKVHIVPIVFWNSLRFDLVSIWVATQN